MNGNDQGGGPPANGDPPLLRLDKITKRFPGVLALDQVDFDLRAGEVHVLFGENGAGKSTLISILAGALRPDGGRIAIHGEPVDLVSVHHARALGISAVFQEFSLIPQLTVEQNLFLGAEETSFGMLNKTALHEGAAEILKRLGFPLQPTQRVAFLSRAEQQMVEIAKAFRADLSVLILDEPTASLTDRETEQLFALIEQVKAEGVGIIYITHRMNEIRRIGDRITVLRDGRYVSTVDARTSEDELVRLMTGRLIEQIFPDVRFQPGEKILEVDKLSTADGTVSDVSLHVRRGEIVGLAGLVGSGKSEVARACFGLLPVLRGQVKFAGEETTGFTPRQMLDRGFFYVPPDRRDEGLQMMRSVRENIALPALSMPDFSRGPLLRRQAESARTTALAKRLNLQPLRLERAVDHFSGGNQQKVLLAKSLTREVGLFVFDEPTVGVDVGTRVAIYEFVGELCEAGAAILFISSDLPEILHMTNRVYVMCRGGLAAELSGDDISQESVLRHCFEREAA
jgi:ribose transport system ATP-binding protein